MTTREIIQTLTRQGWRCEQSRRRSHWKCYPPNDNGMIIMASTPSDHRSWLNARARLRRAGADL